MPVEKQILSSRHQRHRDHTACLRWRSTGLHLSILQTVHSPAAGRPRYRLRVVLHHGFFGGDGFSAVAGLVVTGGQRHLVGDL